MEGEWKRGGRWKGAKGGVRKGRRAMDREEKKQKRLESWAVRRQLTLLLVWPRTFQLNAPPKAFPKKERKKSTSKAEL